MNIIFDYNRTLFDPETDSLYQGVFELLQNLALRHNLFLISRNEVGRQEKIKNLGIRDYFNKVIFTDNKTLQVFEDLSILPNQTMIVGDRITEEICIGNQMGFITIRVKQGKFANEIPLNYLERPTHTISNLMELSEIIFKYEN